MDNSNRFSKFSFYVKVWLKYVMFVIFDVVFSDKMVFYFSSEIETIWKIFFKKVIL